MEEETRDTSTESDAEAAPADRKKTRAKVDDKKSDSAPSGAQPAYDLEAHSRLRARLKAKYRIGGRG